MPSSMLALKPEDVDNEEKRKNFTVAIVGCGLTGILHAYLFAKAGFKVNCTDLDPIKIETIAKEKNIFLERKILLEIRKKIKKGLLEITDNVEDVVSSSNILILTFPIKLNRNKKSDYSTLEKICKKIGPNLKRGSLVIVANATGIGITEGLIKQILENSSGFKAGIGFGLAYSPLESLGGEPVEALTNSKRIVAATDNKSLNSASIVLENIANISLAKLKNKKTAEAAIIFNVVHHDVNVALANELAHFCEKVGIDYFDVHKIVNNLTKPMISVSNTCMKPYLLIEDAENLNLKMQLPKLSRKINEKIEKHATNLVREALKTCGKPLRRAKLSFLGITQSSNTRSPPQKAMIKLIKMLEAKGAKITVYDPYIKGCKLPELPYFITRTLTEAVEGADCIIIGKGHNQLKRLNLNKLKITVKMPAAIVDLEESFDPDKVEKAGFIYRGLGRGVWTK